MLRRPLRVLVVPTLLTVTVLAFSSDFVFEVSSPYPIAPSPDAPFVADFNDDGHIDLAVSHFGGNFLSLLYGDGTGSFAPYQTVESGIPNVFGPVSVSVADFNEDAVSDLLLGFRFSTVAILLGDGLGGFEVDSVIDNLHGVAFAVSADFNGDGHEDFAVTETEIGPREPAVNVFLGDGTGSFAPPERGPVTSEPSELFVVDWNRDSRSDLLVGHSSLYTQGEGSLGVILGDGAGNFSTEEPLVSGYGGTLASADFNDDGTLDLAIRHYPIPTTLDNAIAVYLADHRGHLHLNQSLPSFSIAGPYGPWVADFDRDQITDLLFGNGGDLVAAINVFTTYHGNGIGGFIDPSNFSPFLYSVGGAAIGDFDEDSLPDFAVVGLDANAFLHLNRTPPPSFRRGDADANGVFRGLADVLFILNFQFLPGSATPSCPDAADFDDDGFINGLADGIAALNFQYVVGSPPPPPPGPTQCGADPTADSLGCGEYEACP